MLLYRDTSTIFLYPRESPAERGEPEASGGTFFRIGQHSGYFFHVCRAIGASFLHTGAPPSTAFRSLDAVWCP